MLYLWIKALHIIAIVCWFAGLARLPAGTDGIVLDRSVFGARAFRRIPSPEYVGSSESGIETWSRRDPVANDQWLIRGRRSMIGVIQEPRAARKLTGIYS